MNDIITIGILSLFIGVAVGALAVLFWDRRSWGEHLEAARGERNDARAELNKLQADLQSAEKMLAVAQKEIDNLAENIQEKEERISQLDTEKTVLQSKLDSADEDEEVLSDNLTHVNSHVNELREDLQKLQTELQATAGQNLLLQENVERYQTQLEEVRVENQDVCQKLAVADVEMAHLQKSLEEAQLFEEKAGQLQEQKDALLAQLTEANQQILDLKAQVEGSVQQLTETQFLRKRLIESEANIKAANKQIETLQEKLSNVQETLDYTGKSQLQIIRGIGPAYARRLQEAGINTLHDLAKCKPEDITDTIQLKPWQNAMPGNWIQEARALTTNLVEEEAESEEPELKDDK